MSTIRETSLFGVNVDPKYPKSRNYLITYQKYGEGEIPFQAKTGSGPLLLTVSIPYVRDWLNEHPFRNEPNARLICNLHNERP